MIDLKAIQRKGAMKARILMERMVRKELA